MASSQHKSEGGGGGGGSTLTLTAPPPPGSRPHLPVGGPPQRPLSARPLSNGASGLTSHQSGPRASPVSMSGPSFQKPAPGSGTAGAYGGGQPSDNSAESDKSLKMKIKRTKSGQLKTEDFKSGGQQPPHTNGNSEPLVTSRPSSPLENGITGKLSVVTNANTVPNTPRGVKVSTASYLNISLLQCRCKVFHENHTQFIDIPPAPSLEGNIFQTRFLFRSLGNQKIVSKNLKFSSFIPSQI